MRRRAFLGRVIGSAAAVTVCQGCAMPRPAPTPIGLSAFPSWLQPPTRQASVAFENVTLIPMDTERTLPHQTVLVRDGWIQAIGPAGLVTLPPGTVRVPGQGRYLMPGLADMHVHLTEAYQGLMYLANGVTTVRNMWGVRGIHLEAERSAQRGELLLPVLHTTGPITDGSPPSLPQYMVVNTADEATRQVEIQHDAGYTSVKVYNNLTFEAYQAIVAAARRLSMPVVGHVPYAVGLRAALRAEQHSIEHLTGFREAGGFARETAPLLAGWARDAGTWNCPTLTVHHQLASTEELAVRLARPEVRYLSRGLVNTWRGRSPSGATAATLEAFGTLTRSLRDARADLLLGSDTINPWVVPGFSIHEELGHFVAAGLTAFEAFSAGTRDAARFLGQANEFGTIQIGKRADLLLLEADPLADVANIRRRVGVMTRGRWLTEADLQSRLEALAAANA